VVQSLISAYTTEREVVDDPLVEEQPDRPLRWQALRRRWARRRSARQRHRG